MTVFEGVVARPSTDRSTRVSTRARHIEFHPVRTLVAVLAFLLVSVGRVTYEVLAGLWFAVTWVAAAVALGWSEGREARVPRETDS